MRGDTAYVNAICAGSSAVREGSPYKGDGERRGCVCRLCL